MSRSSVIYGIKDLLIIRFSLDHYGPVLYIMEVFTDHYVLYIMEVFTDHYVLYIMEVFTNHYVLYITEVFTDHYVLYITEPFTALPRSIMN